MKKLDGRDALLRVRAVKPNTDAEHRVPPGSVLYAQPNFFKAPLNNGDGGFEETVGVVVRSVGRLSGQSPEACGLPPFLRGTWLPARCSVLPGNNTDRVDAC